MKCARNTSDVCEAANKGDTFFTFYVASVPGELYQNAKTPRSCKKKWTFERAANPTKQFPKKNRKGALYCRGFILNNS